MKKEIEVILLISIYRKKVNEIEGLNFKKK